MVRNCDNCKNQDVKKIMQDCNTFGYPLFNEYSNWKPKNDEIKNKLELDE